MTMQRSAQAAMAHLIPTLIDVNVWCGSAVPVQAWADKVFPDLPADERMMKLWDAIFAATRVYEDDPVAAWQTHQQNLIARRKYMNDKQYTALHFTGDGTDLTIGLPQGHVWAGGASEQASGKLFTPNIPTDEMFTMPHRERVNGTVKALIWATEQGHTFDFGLVGEPSSADTFGDTVKIGRRGSLGFTVTVEGEQGHVAYPDKARNPLPTLAGIAHHLSYAKLDEGNENFQPTNLEITSIDVGNVATNVIPAKGSLKGNIRFNDIWDADKLGYWLSQQILKVPANGCDVELNIKQPVSRSFVSHGSEHVDLLVQSVETVAGQVPKRSTGGGTSDARFIADYCPVAEFGLVGKTMHQVDERVQTQMVLELQSVYAHFLASFAKQR